MITKNKFLTLDTETVGLPPKNFVYDLGYTIHDKSGNVFLKRNFLVRDIITDPSKMMSAFYAKKIFSYYIPAIDAGKISLWNWSDIAAQLAADMVEHSVNVITAYNARFDIGAMRSTNSILNGSQIVPYPVRMICIWNFACKVLLNRSTYHRLAAQHGWISDAGNVRTTAEHTYRYITGIYDFIESHTALDDAIIETAILAKCFDQKKKIPYDDLATMPWQIAQEVA